MSSIKIVEVLDFGMSLLSNGSVLKADGTIISQEDYETMQLNAQRNKLDWSPIDINEFTGFLESAIFATKTYAIEEQVGGISSSKYGFALIDSDGEPMYLRASEFSGSETFEMTPVTYSKLIYNVDKNSTEEAFEAMVDSLETLFDIKEQVGSMFSPDSETNYLIRKFIKDGYVYSAVYRDGKLSNIKQGNKLHSEAQAQPKQSNLADMLNNSKFANLH